jgi:hypothetical protein
MNTRHEITLLSPESIDGFQSIHLTGTEAGGDWSVRSRILHGGLQEGVEVVEINNGHLSFSVLASRGMGIWKGQCGEVTLGWNSPVKMPVHPKFINEQERGGLGWLKGFNEWFVRCGINSMGAPGTDVVLDYSGNEMEVPLTLHGKIANIPAHAVSLTVTDKEIILRGDVDETMMFGYALRLHTEIRTEFGSGAMSITDTVTNLGDNPVEHEMLYHINYGETILEEGSRFIAPYKKVVPRDPRSTEGGVDTYNVYGPSQIGFVEQAYLHQLAGTESEQETLVMLQNADATQATVLRYSLDDFPCFTLWKNPAGKKDGYVTGLEPATNFPNSRRFERQQGRVISLQGGESRTTVMKIEALEDPQAIENAAAEIEKLQATVEGTLEPQPLPDFSG